MSLKSRIVTWGSSFIRKFERFRSSIYGRVVIIITISSFVLFLTFWIVFRSVTEGYMNRILHQNGNNIGSLVEASLYKSMLENDRSTLQSTLDFINTLSGIDEVNMYDNNGNLAYSSISKNPENHTNPDCLGCHPGFSTMFHKKEKSYKIIDVDSECSMNPYPSSIRHLLISSPVLNAPSCYTASCHAHSSDEEVLGSLLIKFPLNELDDAISKSARDYFLLAVLITIIIVVILIIFTSKKIRQPLHDLVVASEAVAAGDRRTRLEIKSNQLSDMKKVSLAFNDMLDNLQQATVELQNWSHQLEYKVRKKSEELGQVQAELINIERIASLGRLSLSVAHEINNPLSGILVYAKLVQKQLLSQNLDPEKRETIMKHLRLVESEAKRCGDIVKGLLDFSRKDQNDYENRKLHDILRETFDLMAHSMKVANVHFLTNFQAGNDLVFCNPNQIKQVFVALLVNSLEAVSENGEILINTTNPDGEHLRAEVVDNGLGIPEEAMPHIFEPFFSTKEKANGIGLGLAIVHGIVKSHKGKIDVRSERGKGTTIAITFPLVKN